MLVCRQLDDRRKQQQVQRAFEADFLQPGGITEPADGAPAAAGPQWNRFAASGAAGRGLPPSLWTHAAIDTADGPTAPAADRLLVLLQPGAIRAAFSL